LLKYSVVELTLVFGGKFPFADISIP
jgi:hypothetical protein